MADFGVFVGCFCIMTKLQEFEESLPNDSYLYYCFEAMKDLYKSLDWVCFHKENMDDDDVQVYERNYIISLASMLSKKGLELPGLINGEVAKSLDTTSRETKEKYIELKRKQNPSYEPRSCYVFPDFLIHKSHSPNQDAWTIDNQHIIIEAKTAQIKDKYSFFGDYFKLNFYLDELHFEYAIYIIVQTPFSDICKYLSEYEDEIDFLSSERFSRMFFFIQEKIDCEPKIYRIINA